MAINATNTALQTSNLLNGIFTSILSVFGTLFNAYIIQHFYKKLSSSQKRKNINTLMLGQSIVDFYNSAIAGPSNAVYYFGSYHYGSVFEKTLYFKLIDIISPSLYVTSLQISMLCFLLTAIDRLLSITFPVFHHVASTPKKLKTCMVFMWIGSILFSCVGEVFCHIWKNFYNNPSYTIRYHVWILVLDTILVVLIALLWVSTIFTSCSAIKKAFERKKTLRPSEDETAVERNKRKLQEKHLMQMFALMFFIFALAFIPSLIFWFMDNKGLYQENPEVIIAWHCSSTTFALSSACNPLFMMYYAPDFKRKIFFWRKQNSTLVTESQVTSSEVVICIKYGVNKLSGHGNSINNDSTSKLINLLKYHNSVL
ncbi:growth hormone secretagogue receptor type 1-like [Clytia hemisphaerica]|uniref:G-protein coupled receptors family 1 profile domain-containing protein n=1 Tax=Clytia hemisphaerica TaxID=252671 RepID=A0A7M5WJB3_9CNID|eukprot:TCONS_00001681-protein